MSEEKIERQVESKMDSLDRQLMSGRLSQREYDQKVKDLNKWAEQQYELLSRNR
jgi:hypothetical protein